MKGALYTARKGTAWGSLLSDPLLRMEIDGALKLVISRTLRLQSYETWIRETSMMHFSEHSKKPKLTFSDVNLKKKNAVNVYRR